MHQLRQLVKLLDGQPGAPTGIHFNTPRTRELYNYLKNNPNADPDELARQLGLGKDGSLDEQLKWLKRDLLRAVTTPSEPPDEGGTDSDRRRRLHAYIWRLIALGKERQHNLTTAAVLPFLEEAYTLAERHRFIEAAYQSAVMLRRQYANRHYHPEKYLRYSERVYEWRQRYRDYQDVVADLNELLFRRNRGDEGENILPFAQRIFDRHRPLIERHDIVSISYLVYLIEVHIHLLSGDYRQVSQVALRALDYLKDRPHTQPTMVEVFEANLAVALTQLDDYAGGKHYALAMLKRTDRQSYNYVKVYELLMTLSLRAGHAQEAYHWFKKLHDQDITSNLRDHYYETFRIIEAYLYLLVRLGAVRPDDDDSHFETFRIRRFVNSFEHATGEKQHRNVHLLIVQLIAQVLDSDRSQARLSVEAITKYGNRYLKDRRFGRTRAFLLALAQLPAQRFHRAAVERHAAKHLARMRRYPLQPMTDGRFIELIPYEQLWQLITAQLSRRK